MINALKNIGIHIYPKSSSRKNAHLFPFWGKNARLMSHFRPNVFFGKMFPRFWDIQQNDFGTIGMQQSSKWPNVFSWKMFPRFWDMHAWCFFLSCDWNPMSLQKSMCK
jgi:hypothetical protein